MYDGADGSVSLYTIDVNGLNLHRVRESNGDDEAGAISPDNDRIVFTDNSMLATMDLDGSDVEYLLPGWVDSGEFNPRWSPDGSQITFWAVAKWDFSTAEVWVFNADGTGGTDVTNTLDNAEQLPDFSPDGDGVVFDRETDWWHVWKSDIDGSDAHQVIGPYSWAASYRSPRTSVTDSGLLRQYAPRLVYSATENSPALSASSITDNVPPTTIGSANRLCVTRDPCTVRADPTSFDPSHRLALGYLGGSSYLDGSSVSESDYIAEADADGTDGKIADGQRLYGDGRNAHVYGRVIRDAGEPTYLQYWFFYYYDYVPGGLGFGEHEGDWEMVQYRLNGQDIPDSATYSRHRAESVTCPYSRVNRILSIANRPAPIVYVATGTHASYFSPDSYGRPFPAPDDNATGDGAFDDSLVEAEFTGSGPDWLLWPGMWGGTPPTSDPNSLNQPSPRGPLFQGDKSYDPAAFESAGGACDSAAPFPDGAAASRRSTRRIDRDTLPLVAVTSAKQYGGLVVVRYRVRGERGDAKSRRAVRLIVTIDAAGRRFRHARPTSPWASPAGPYARSCRLGTGLTGTRSACSRGAPRSAAQPEET